jgi:hypothetical protein
MRHNRTTIKKEAEIAFPLLRHEFSTDEKSNLSRSFESWGTMLDQQFAAREKLGNVLGFQFLVLSYSGK